MRSCKTSELSLLVTTLFKGTRGAPRAKSRRVCCLEPVAFPARGLWILRSPEHNAAHHRSTR